MINLLAAKVRFKRFSRFGKCFKERRVNVIAALFKLFGRDYDVAMSAVFAVFAQEAVSIGQGQKKAIPDGKALFRTVKSMSNGAFGNIEDFKETMLMIYGIRVVLGYF